MWCNTQRPCSYLGKCDREKYVSICRNDVHIRWTNRSGTLARLVTELPSKMMASPSAATANLFHQSSSVSYTHNNISSWWCLGSQICTKLSDIHSRFVLKTMAKHSLNFAGSQDANTLQRGSRWRGSTPLTLCHCLLQSGKLTTT